MDGIRIWMELDRNSMLDVEAKRNADHESLCVHPKLSILLFGTCTI